MNCLVALEGLSSTPLSSLMTARLASPSVKEGVDTFDDEVGSTVGDAGASSLDKKETKTSDGGDWSPQELRQQVEMIE